MNRSTSIDTGALIALESRRKRMKEVLAAARTLRLTITVPSVVIAEWWRKQTGPIAGILEGVVVERLDERLARIAGEALLATRGSNAVDAIVMASAAQRGDIVYTSELAELSRLRGFFPEVRVLAA